MLVVHGEKDMLISAAVSKAVEQFSTRVSGE
jgi:hypothetical protein